MKEKTTKTKKEDSMKTLSKESDTDKINKTEIAKQTIIKIIESTTPADYVELQTRWLDVTGPNRRMVYSITVEKEGNIIISPKDRAEFSMFDNDDDL